MERKLKPPAADGRSIDIEDDYALDFWSRAFGVSAEKIKVAVKAVGNSAIAVQKELKNKPVS
jgi:hypothetical protein